MTRVFRKLLSAAVVMAVVAAAVDVRATAPTPTDPSNMAGGGLPGTFPITVTAANMTVEQFTPAVLNGSGSNNLRVSFPASGPIKWTESRHNEGDIALLIGPGNPNDSSYFPPTSFVDNYQPLSSGQPFSNTTLGWRLSRATGAALATVRHNGVNYGSNYTFNGTPVGTVHGISYFNATGASGWGFRMDDGVFNNGGGASTDLQMGIAGFDQGQGEGSSSTAVAYFPYEQGWVGAWVNGGDEGEATYANSSSGLPTSAVNWSGSVANVQLAGVNSATDGMLFVAPTHDNNNTNIAAAFPTGGGWNVTVREDDNSDVTGNTINFGTDNGFQFLYVPYSAPGLTGGQVKGSDGSLIHSAGSPNFNVTRTAAGQYAVSVFGAGGKRLTENDGMLVLSVAGSMAGAPTLADRAFLSYQYTAVSGDYNNDGTVNAADYVLWRDGGVLQNDPTPGVQPGDYNVWKANFGLGGTFNVQSRELAATNSANTENQFGDDLALRDADFYFAWISFTNPLTPSGAGLAAGQAVPEPSSLGLCAILVGVLLGARAHPPQRSG